MNRNIEEKSNCGVLDTSSEEFDFTGEDYVAVKMFVDKINRMISFEGNKLTSKQQNMFMAMNDFEYKKECRKLERTDYTDENGIIETSEDLTVDFYI